MRRYLLLNLLLCISFFSFSQSSVGIGTSSPQTSALLEISSKTKGVLIPRLTNAERSAIVSPVKGLMVYDSTFNSFFYYNGTAWKSFRAALIVEDEDGDTKVQVEKNPNENILRVDLAGIEKLTVKAGRMEFPNNDSNIYIGYLNGFTNTTGFRNTGIGNEALRQNQAGAFNTAIGFEAIKLNNSGNSNTAVGYQTLYTNLFGNSNMAAGVGSLYSNIDGNLNTAVGTANLYLNTTGDGNIAIGNQSLFQNTSGNRNIAIGNMALMSNTVKNNLIAIGDSALYNNGNGAVVSTNSINNLAIGEKALKNNSFGSQNTAVGSFALLSNTGGSDNTAFGYRSQEAETLGSFNTTIGSTAGLRNTTGSSLTAIGYAAGSNNTTGVSLTAVGVNAGLNNTTGNSNTAIGNAANFGAGNLTNATAIGASAMVNTSNSMVLGSGVNVGIGTSSPIERLHVVGNIKTDGFIMNTDAGLGKLLISDASGNAFWGVISRIQRLSIAAASFRPVDFAHESQLFPEGEIVGTNNATLTAPVNLPDGAIITNVFFNVFDGSDVKQVVGKLYAFQNGSASVTELTSGLTGMAFNGGYTTFNTSINHTVNNSINSYAVYAYSNNGAPTFWSDMKLESVIITYTFNMN